VGLSIVIVCINTLLLASLQNISINKIARCCHGDRTYYSSLDGQITWYCTRLNLTISSNDNVFNQIVNGCKS
jgi:hypothetical protein